MPAADTIDFVEEGQEASEQIDFTPEEAAAPIPPLSPQALALAQWRSQPNPGMESGTELTTALAGGVQSGIAKAAAVIPPTFRTIADFPSQIARSVSQAQGHYAEEPLVGEERAAQSEGFGASMQKPFVPLDLFKMQDEEGDPAWATAVKEAERMLVGIPEFIESPLGVLTMGTGAGGKISTDLTRYAFAGDMVKSMFQQLPQLRDNWDTMSAGKS